MVQQVASGQVKAYGITAKEPSPLFPKVPSFVQELGPKLEILYWHALFAPAGTPDAVVDKLNAALQAIIADPAIVKAWADTGVAPYPKEQRSPAAARQLASRARRRVQGRAPAPERNLREQRRVVDAFMAAAREGDFEGLVAVLHPDIVLRADAGALAGRSRVVRGAREVAAQAATFSRSGLASHLVLVNGQLGFVSRRPDGRVFSVMGLTIADGQIVEMNILADPERLGRLELPPLDG